MKDNFNDLKLKIELIPSTVWYSSIYQRYKQDNKLNEWQKIKNKLFKEECRQCWICGRTNCRLEAHEFWEYDDTNHIQTLIAIHHLCDLCHKIKHIGFWCHTPEGIIKLKKVGLTKNDLITHFCKVNNCYIEQFKTHEDEAFKIWNERSKHKWKQNLGSYN